MENHFRVLVYETSVEIKKLLHDALVGFAVNSKTEIKIDWIKPNASHLAVSRASVSANVAFINAENVNRAVDIGKCIYENNSDCALIYYGNPAQDTADQLIDYFRRLFPSRPVEFITELNMKLIYQAVCRVSTAIISHKVFVWENRGLKYRIPYASILYFRSDRNYVNIRLISGEEFSFLGKLTDVEKRIDENYFVRVHQSYLISKSTIVFIDKSRKCVRLFNGEEVFISKAHYKDTLKI